MTRRREALIAALISAGVIFALALFQGHTATRARIEAHPILLIAVLFIGLASALSLLVAIYDALTPWDRP